MPSESYGDAIARRASVREALRCRLVNDGDHDLAARLTKCGQTLNLLCTCCGQLKPVLTRCDLKWCPSCQPALSARTAARYEAITAECDWPLFVTWTTKNFDDNTLNFVRHVRRSFAKLRRLRWWKRRVQGGVASIEVTNIGNGWHPHVHSLLDCQWLAVDEAKPRIGASKAEWKNKARRVGMELAEQWSLCLARPGSVKVRRVWARDGGDSKPVTSEVLKYSCKGTDLVECEERPGSLIRMLDGCRLVTSWGTFYGHPATKRQHKAGAPCDKCGAKSAWLPEAAMEKMWGTQGKRRGKTMVYFGE